MGIAAILAIAAAVAGSIFFLRGRRPAVPVIARPTLGVLNLDPERFGAMRPMMQSDSLECFPDICGGQAIQLFWI